MNRGFPNVIDDASYQELVDALECNIDDLDDNAIRLKLINPVYSRRIANRIIIGRIRREYTASSERPYKLRYRIPISSVIILLREGLDIVLPDSSKYDDTLQGSEWLFYNRIEGLELIIPILPKDVELKIPSTIDPSLLALINDHNLNYEFI